GTLWLNGRKLGLNTILWLLIPVAIYLFYYFSFRVDPDPKRYQQIYFNFETFIRGRDTIFSLFISFGSLWLLAFCSFIRELNKNKTRQEKFLFWSTIYFTIITVIVTLFFTRARETRILFPPFIFLIPFALNELKKLVSILSLFKSRTLFLLLGCCSYFLTELGLNLAYVLIPEFEYRGCPETAYISLGIHISIILIILEIYLINFYGYINNKLRLSQKLS
ncbi:MAG: hypothetical protein ABIJ12_12170, partial [bacterium]